MKVSPVDAWLLLVAFAAAPCLARQLKSNGSSLYDFTKFKGESCMDSGGESMVIMRDVNLKKCKEACVDNSKCVAITYNEDSRNCYLKSRCLDLHQRDNGDDSLLLDRHPDVTATYEWTKDQGQSCMDNDGDSMEVIRDLDVKHCKAACEFNPQCVAVTVSDSGSCYLKASCNYLEHRNNGDNSYSLDRGNCEPITQVICKSGSTSSKCKEYCGTSALTQFQVQCGGTVYVCE
eukprot:CAMPEP_0117661286 /NCGR_PEP_ID=MMETSP0804-20121206/7456_1 /TAXON_ID=1074897 /ORGANISM="Tetraselmis astigmatica, Strain CCMP880" /LENGTH=232 /DNA_ID=CAMNT_0005468143 /DNA_START=137 /DNA_END=835 /DNA_ORIENTATION=-